MVSARMVAWKAKKKKKNYHGHEKTKKGFTEIHYKRTWVSFQREDHGTERESLLLQLRVKLFALVS